MNEAMHREMIAIVAHAIGREMLQQVAFVGGCTTALLLTDRFSVEQVRHTDDVDLIVHLIGYADWVKMRDELFNKGFTEDISDDPICAMKLGQLRVDFMPDNERVLGFTNRWYADAHASAQEFKLNSELTIRIIRPEYFIATKLEAYLGRGDGDFLGSRDIEDILALIDGRETLIEEIQASSKELQQYISDQLARFLGNRNFEFAMHNATGDAARENELFERINQIIAIGSN